MCTELQQRSDEVLSELKARIACARARVAERLAGGTPGLENATTFCVEMETILLDVLQESLSEFAIDEIAALAERSVLIAVGGTGRGELCPFSDIDLMFLDQGADPQVLQNVRDMFLKFCWDAKLDLGHCTRTIKECLTLARNEPEVATSLIEARRLWGSQKLFETFQKTFRKKVISGRRKAFLEDCWKARMVNGPQAQELEPDIKNSIGGLRDLHLLRWLSFAILGVKDLDDIRRKGLLSSSEVRQLKAGWNFLSTLRIDLHLHAGREQDRLTRDEQLRIAKQRGIVATDQQLPIERLMQEYFGHASTIATITRRFAARHRPRSLVQNTRNLIVGHRADGVLRVHPNEIDARGRDLKKVCASLDSILKMYKAAALYGVMPSPRLTDAVKSAASKQQLSVTPESGRLFRDLLGQNSQLGPILRSLFETDILEILIPDFAKIHCLIQFNQYHHFTVDEHTFQAMEVMSQFEQEDSPFGAAYRSLKQKDVLHLALLLHDVGKGQVNDHCIVGEEIARRIAPQLSYNPEETEQIAFLVRQHLEMADIAFRRDISDEKLLLQFSRLVGSPETLRMLYVLTAADVSAVGPGVWNEWKADLLTELFDRTLLILSGKHYSFHEAERMKQVKSQVAKTVVSIDPTMTEQAWHAWIDRQLEGFSAYYLTCTSPEQIAADLDVIQRLQPDEIHIDGTYDASTMTVNYRLITRNANAREGAFHLICGVFAAKRCEILSADINTTHGGVVVDTFQVTDTDFTGEVPRMRIDEVSQLLSDVLLGNVPIEDVMQRGKRFGSDEADPVVSNLKPRVVIDNESSDSRTIFDIFAHDRPGLLYTVARTLHELDVSVNLAKISTHFDQVVDVMYLTELDGSKITDPERLEQIRNRLLARIDRRQETS